MGTVVSIDVRTPLPPPALDAAIETAVAVLHQADEDFSTFRPESWVSRLRGGEVDLADCPEHVREVYRLAGRCRDATGGWFDPAWRRDGTLDPTGLVKGWAADAASAALIEAGAPDHCVNAAGDLRIRGAAGPSAEGSSAEGSGSGKPWRIGIVDPFDRGGLVAVVEGTDLAVATSGIAERGSHVVDPSTGVPASGLASVTVVGSDLTVADAYATAALAAGSDTGDLLAEFTRAGWAWLTVTTTGRIRAGKAFPGQLAAGRQQLGMPAL